MGLIIMAGRKRTGGQRITIPNDLDAIGELRVRILREVAQNGYNEQAYFAIALGLAEALSNAYRHGNQRDPGKHILVRFGITPELVVIEIEDEGEGFDPDSVPDPTTPENVGRIDGRGIFLMRAYLDEVSFSCHGKRVRLLKHGAGRQDSGTQLAVAI
jgi:serine/threonine-protein kinase RsbW